MRLDETCRVEWSDLDVARRMLLIRDRKDPRKKTGNDDRITLFAATGFEVWAQVTEQTKYLGHTTRWIFPYNSKLVGMAIRRTCVQVGSICLVPPPRRLRQIDIGSRFASASIRHRAKA